MDQLHCRTKRGVTLAEEIVCVLKIRHYADAFKLNRGFLPIPEGVAQKRNVVKINTAAQYGMNIRVTVQRGDALTACWVSGIGGNFE